jgi:hypothetical protein
VNAPKFGQSIARKEFKNEEHWQTVEASGATKTWIRVHRGSKEEYTVGILYTHGNIISRMKTCR